LTAFSFSYTSSSIQLYVGAGFHAKPVRSPMTISVVAA